MEKESKQRAKQHYWTQEDDKFITRELYDHSIEDVAKMMGLTYGQVLNRMVKIGARRVLPKDIICEYAEETGGTRTLQQMSEDLGYSEQYISSVVSRCQLPYRRTGKQRADGWTKHEDEIIMNSPADSDIELAKQLGRTQAAIQARRGRIRRKQLMQ